MRLCNNVCQLFEDTLKKHSGEEKTNKCSQCNNASSEASNLRRHMSTHTGEKTNKCNQCDVAFSQADTLREHLELFPWFPEMHQGKKSIKCSQCGYAYSFASNLRTHMKTHSRKTSNKCKKLTSATSVIKHTTRQALWENIWKLTAEKKQTNVSSAAFHPSRQAI